MALATTIADTAVDVTSPSSSWAARARGTSVMCFAVAAAALAHNPIATVSARAVARRPRE